MTHILGISAGYHDAAAAMVDQEGRIVFAAHSERYSRNKNDPGIDPALENQLRTFDFSTVAFYERPLMHNLQKLRSGQRPFGAWTTYGALCQHLPSIVGVGESIWSQSIYNWPMQDSVPQTSLRCFQSFAHHLSHAAAGFQTSPFDRAAVVVIDAIGELDTISIYRADYDDQGRAQYKRMWRQRYPHSIGLFYSAITQAIGLRPMDEEYITMGMAAYGSSLGAGWMRDQFVADIDTAQFKRNLHLGFDQQDLTDVPNEDIAASAQALTEQLLDKIMYRARALTGCDNLVYMGGVALNCVANARVLGRYFDQIWIMPNPGDAGSSLGAAALSYGGRLRWRDAFLGHEIPGEYPIKEILDHLIKNQIVGVASGKAEFGPRALGNRSLLADPRGWDIKDRVNSIKRRQKYRPFAPVILEELAQDYFLMPPKWDNSRYMQIVADCRAPDLYPAICHVDGTSRVQTVPRDGSGIRRLLEAWYLLTGCPMLLNTSLNVRGEPMVNDRKDADRFEKIYGVRVYS